MSTGLYKNAFFQGLFGPSVSQPLELEHSFSEILAAGRQSWSWDGGGGNSDGHDPSAFLFPPSQRRPTTVEDGHLWSSHSRLSKGLHMPVFDMDMPRTPEVEAAVNRAFPVGEVRWVESSTEGHHHVYVEGVLVLKDQYFEVLEALAESLGDLDPDDHLARYLAAQKDRGGTFVRMPHVKKGTLPRELEPTVPYKGLRQLIESGWCEANLDQINKKIDLLEEGKQSASFWYQYYKPSAFTKLTDIPPF